MAEFPAVLPFDEAVAALDEPEAVADRKIRARKWAEALEGRERGDFISKLPRQELDTALLPLMQVGPFANLVLKGVDTRPSKYVDPVETKRAAELEAGRNMDALVARWCEIHLRMADERVVMAEPQRQELHRVFAAYDSQIRSIAWAQGDKIQAFSTRYSKFLEDRREAEEVGDAAGMRAAEARLYKLTGIPYPSCPESSWATADTLPATEREAEYLRLEAAYGPRNQPADAALASTKRRRELRSKSHHTTTVERIA